MAPDTGNSTAAPLQFDRVVSTAPAERTAMRCGRCEAPIVGQYYHEAGATLCASCGEVRQRETAPDRRLLTLVRATALGFGASLVGALVYWALMEYADLQIGIVAVGIGWLVGRAVARGTRGRSARRHRIAAVVLTYLAVGVAYMPFAMKGMSEGKGKAAAAGSASVAPAIADSTRAAPPTAGPAPAGDAKTAAATRSAAREPMTPGAFAIGVLALLAMALALPVMATVLSGAGGVISVIIIGVGLLQAWKVAHASNVEVTGPLTLTTPTPS